MISHLLAILLSGVAITFPSEESRTDTGTVVWNKVSYSHEKGTDVWKMRQSHYGPAHPTKDWDELKIVVKDKKVEFFQLKNNQEIPFKISCFQCHSNGPRAIRPDVTNKLTSLEKAQITLMNLRIKSYGVLTAVNKPLFKHEDKMSNAILELPKCIRCHNDSGWFSRNYLTRQNAPTITFMVKKEHMPPIGGLTLKEKKYMNDFLNGF
jgi:hypothetical protein